MALREPVVGSFHRFVKTFLALRGHSRTLAQVSADILRSIGFKNATRVDALLSDLCLRKGICLPPDEHDRLVASPPTDPDAFVAAILIADGEDPVLASKQVKQWVSEAVRDWIFDEGRGKGTASGLPLTPPVSSS